jgi:hypothetical protein
MAQTYKKTGVSLRVNKPAQPVARRANKKGTPQGSAFMMNLKKV